MISTQDEKRITSLLKNHNFSSSSNDGSPSKTILLGRPFMHLTKNKTPEDLFKSIGPQIVDSLDLNTDEGANIVHNLNNPIPEKLHKKYSLIVDNGTMEHCFDPKQVLFNINSLLAKNGIVFHINPINNYINHGFYSFSPCLYLSFYAENNYEILDMIIVGEKKEKKLYKRFINKIYKKVFRSEKPLFKLPEYRVVSCKHFKGKDLEPFFAADRIIIDSKRDPNIAYNIYFTARKLSDITDSSIPIQPIYSGKYKQSNIIHV
tara:strand:- start:257 stop:1042 length:786 start_codon:yes stop_codon:yes gene_type:complete